jgi:hypothetical protein
MTFVAPGRPPQVHQVRSFPTQEACQAFQQQLAQAYEEADRRAVPIRTPQGKMLQQSPQRLYDCEERQGE